MGGYKYYEVIGRQKPEALLKKLKKKGNFKEEDAKDAEEPKIYRMKIFAPNTVVARSRFWYFLSKLKKIKRANGEIIAVNEIFEAQPNQIKTYGIWLRYDSRSGTHNMYKEFRDTSLTGAVGKMYAELASRHRCRKMSVQIRKTCVVDEKDVTDRIKPYVGTKDTPVAFTLLHRVPRASSNAQKKVFAASRPVTFF